MPCIYVIATTARAVTFDCHELIDSLALNEDKERAGSVFLMVRCFC